MAILKRFRALIGLLLVLGFIYLFNQETAQDAVFLTWDSLVDMMALLPPILMLVGLMDQWIDKEMLMKYMGDDSKFTGIFITLLLGGLAAGPLYIAFPIAIMLLKKGSNIRYVVFFFGVWTIAKLPIVLYEIASFGWGYTIVHVGFGLVFFYIMGIIFERIFDKDELIKQDIT
ncbi:Predicted permease [Pelagirhabdus alkalitolerans]|uniref:Predicted permease n=1 Tax=Pelagirhabdus alkalitolerans TaxID=1612202 RepID=A0A1G6KNP0_9BACI|nr:permease [Pelagirhabdus alkalitolerans]SDC32689.1 Predicted permease [Pelagirhabdus alkalitolerans]